MANQIILKRSSQASKVPTTAQLELGEIAINTYDGRIFIKKNNGATSVVEIGGVTTVNTYGGAVVLNADDVLEKASSPNNLYFTNARARAALSGTGSISYSSSTGVITTTQSITTAATPTFAGLTLTGNMGITGNITPSASNTYSLGTASYPWKDVFVGPGTLYVNGKAVIQDTSGTMTFSTDTDQNMRITTAGTGVLQLGSSTTLTAVSGTLQIQSGKNVTDSAGVAVSFGNAINMNTAKIIGLGTPSANTDAATKGYVDSTVGALSTSSITQGNSSVSVVDTGTGSITLTADGSTAMTADATGVTISGNLTVNGTTTTVNSNTINLADNIITLNSDWTGSASQNAGVEVNRGDDSKVSLRWNEGSDIWQFTNDGATYYPMAVNTDGLAEGSTNQYHTTTRARAALSATTATGVSYSSATGVISLGSIPNTALANNSITINGTATALGGTRTLTTSDVAEGTSLYYTDTRARAALSATTATGVAYNSSTGVISLASVPNSSLTNSSVTIGSTALSLGATSTVFAGLTSVTSTSFVGALTGNATTATTLATARTINGVSFDGSAAVTVHTAGTGISVSGTSVAIDTAVTVDKTTTQTLTNKTLTSPTINGATIGGHLLPSTDVTYNLGSATYRFKDLFLSGNTIQLGTATISASGSGVGMSSLALTGATSGTVTLTPPAVAGTTAISIPATNGTLVTTGDTGTVTSTMIADGTIVNGDISASAAIAYSKLALTGAILNADLAGSIATSKITGLATSATTDTTNASNITSGTLPNARLVSVPNSALANSSVTVGTTAIALGASSTTLAGLTSVTSTGFTGALTGNADTATALATGRTIALTGDVTYTSPSFTGAGNVTAAATLATVNSNTGAFGSATAIPVITVNGKGLITAISTTAVSIPSGALTFTGDVTGSGTTGSSTALTIATGAVTNVKLANSSVTVTAGTGMSGGGAVALGSTITLTNAGVTSIVAGTGISVSGATGAVTVTNSITNNNQLTNGSGYVTSSVLASTHTGALSTSSACATGALTVTGAITATGEVTAYYSDINLKKDIVEITDPIAKVMSLRGVTFRPNDTALALGIVDKEEVGVIAQEVEAVLPQLVSASAFEGYKTVKYEKLTALLLEAIKAQQLQLDALTAQIAKLGGSATTEL